MTTIDLEAERYAGEATHPCTVTTGRRRSAVQQLKSPRASRPT